jgi:hypothetical protein
MSAAKETTTTAAKKASEKESRKKWGDELIDAGYTIFPSTLLKRQKALGLDPIHINILMFMFTYWWHADNLPYPSKKTIAEAIGVDPSTVRRRVKEMEGLKLLKRIERRVAHDRSDTNQYSFAGLIKVLKPYALEEIEAKEDIKVAKAKRASRKKPVLKVVEK